MNTRKPDMKVNVANQAQIIVTLVIAQLLGIKMSVSSAFFVSSVCFKDLKLYTIDVLCFGCLFLIK